MKKIWKWSFLIAGVFAAAAAGYHLTRTESNGIFYRVSGGNSTMYLLGSIHVGTQEMYPMSRSIRSALRDADTIVFECDTTSENAVNASARLMESETELRERISPECCQLVEQAAQKLGYRMESLQKLDPWAVASLMTTAAAADELNVGNTKNASAWGVENVIRRQIGERKVEYLETPEDQLGLMENFSSDLQEYLLADACRAVLETSNGNGLNKNVENWPVWWKEGNAKAFAEAYLLEMAEETSPELACEYHQALLVQRNHHMAQRICQMLEDDREHQYFVVVGLMHLVLDDDSILKEMEAAGYRVERVVQ